MPVAVVTGASGGLGHALANLLSDMGWTLILNSLHEHEGNGVWIVGDVSVVWTAERIAEAAKDARGASLLIHCAGKKLTENWPAVIADDMRETLNANLLGPMMLTKRLWPQLTRHKGQVVFVNSLAGLEGAPGELSYCASKHGLAGFAKALQYEGTKLGVRVLSVFVGAMQTPMSEGRQYYEQFIQPLDAAEQILALVDQPRSLRVTEVTIQRSRY